MRKGALATLVALVIVIGTIFPAVGSVYTLLPGHVGLGDEGTSIHVEKGGANRYLYLKTGVIDPLHFRARRGEMDTRYYIVQLKGQEYDSFRAFAKANGCKIEGYIPQGAYLMYVPQVSYNLIENWPGVRVIIPYYPEFKVSPDLPRDGWGNVHVRVMLHDFVEVPRTLGGGVLSPRKKAMATFEERSLTPSLQEVAKKAFLTSLAKYIYVRGGTINRSEHYDLVATIPSALIGDIAQMDPVDWIEPYAPPHPVMDNVRATNNLDYIQNNYGYTGSGVIVGVADTGCDWGHQEFGDSNPNDGQGKILHYLYDTDNVKDDDEGHGTCTAGIIGATGSGDSNAKGMAPNCQLIIQEYIPGYQGDYDQNPPAIYTMLTDAASYGAKIHSDSWGAQGVYGYSSQSHDIDDAVLSTNMVVCFAAGNEGPNANTIATEAEAKNVISVGAVNDYNSPYTSDHDLADFSSRGPANDGRIKPDILATGVGIYTIDIRGYGGYTSGDYTDGQQYFGGTSGATPIVAGGAAVVYEAYRDDFFGNNPNGEDPSAAAIKALLINSAEPLSGHDYSATSNGWYAQGWGELSLNNLFTRSYFIQDESDSDAISQGDTKEFNVAATGNDDLRVTLVWSDPPGSPQAATELVNDLDLEVVAPDNTVYKGNVFSGVYSTTGGSADRKNNVECVYLHQPQGGLYTVRVKGYDIPQGPQKFALVVSGVATGMGLLYLDKKYYNAATTPTISYSDWDYRDGTSGDTISVTVRSEANPTGIPVTLTENGDSGFFQGTFSWSSLGVGHYDNISVSYTDTHPVNRVLYANATYDDIAPNISNFRIAGLGRQYILLSWTTDEISRSVVYLKKEGGTSFEEITPNSIEWFPWQSKDYDYDTYVKDHTMFISGLDPDTRYYVYVASLDHSDNKVVEDNGGSYYVVRTLPPQNMKILLVGDDGSEVYGTASRVDEYYLRNMDLVYDFHRRSGSAPPSLTNYDIVIWECGFEMTGTLNNSQSGDGINDQDYIANYFNNGGNFILSGMNVAWDAFTDFSSQIQGDIMFSQFYQQYFHATYKFYNVLKNSQQPYTTMSGTSGDPISGDYTGNNKVVVYPAQYGDEIGPYNSGVEVFKWDNTGNTSVVRWAGGSKVVTFALMLPSMYYVSQAIDVLYKAMNYMVPFPDDSHISGSVLDKYGKGVSGARVIAYEQGEGTTIRAIDYTNATGQYTLPKLPAGTYDIVAHEDGYQDGEATGISLTSGGQLENINISLDSGSINGYVVGVDGSGLSNVTVWVMKNVTGTPLRTALTDETGLYHITGLESGTYDILFYKGSYMPTWIRDHSHTTGNDETMANVTMNSARATILLVADDNDAGFLPIIYEPLFMANGYLYDTWSTKQSGTPPTTTLANYALVVWLNGLTYDANTLSGGEQSSLQTYLDGGGMLWLIGMDTLYDPSLSPQNSSFVKNYLHVESVDKDKGIGPILYGVSGDAISDGAVYDITDPYGIGDYSDALTPYSGAVGCFYQDRSAGTFSALRYSGAYKVAFFAFDVGLVRTFEERADLVHRAVEWFSPPPPQINSPPTLSSGQVTPSDGNFSTQFTFSVTYTDSDNDPPEYVNLVLDGHGYAMQSASSNDGDYTNGEIYEITLNGQNVGSGNHTFRFEASDGTANAIGSSTTYHGPFINNPPELMYPKVTPLSGTTEDVFQYRVVYKDVDNDPPVGGGPYLYIDSSTVPITMSVDQNSTSAYHDGDYTNGERYLYVTTLAAGSHNFYFRATDGLLEAVSDIIDGPDVTTPGNTLPTLSDYYVTPTSGNVGDVFEFHVTYQDGDNEPPAFIRVYLDSTTYDMKQVDPTDVTYSDGKEYSLSMTINETGTHQYYMEASDGTDTVTTPTVTGPSVSSVGNKAPELYDGGVDPISGTPSTIFRFHVSYKDGDNDGPEGGGPLLYVDGAEIGTMGLDQTATSDLKDGNYMNGERYYYETTLPAGTHSFYFVVSDGTDTETTATFSGPSVGTGGNNVSELRNGKVSPPIGGIGTTFTFSVVYYDRDNQAPSYIRVVIDDGSGSDMSLDTSSTAIYHDGDYTNGEMYRYETTLGSGGHKFHFEASDGIDPVMWPLVDMTGPYVSSLPQITDVGFEPPVGTPETEFTFHAVYVDGDGDAPEYVKLHIGTFVIDMVKEEGAGDEYSSGVTYVAEGITLPASRGEEIYVSTSDGYNGEVNSTIIEGPIVDNIPVLSNGHVSPEGGSVNDTFVFSVNYQDDDGDQPMFVKVVVDDKDEYDLEAEDNGGNYTLGVIFASQPISLSEGDHTYRFVANDSYFNATGDVAPHTGLHVEAGGSGGGSGGGGGGGNVTPPPPEFDKDNDGMNDTWERLYGFDPLDPTDSAEDADGDGLTNLDEFQYGTIPTNPDSDGDELNDSKEISIGTDPLNRDTDGDGMDDGWEVKYALDPTLNDAMGDSDGDGISNLAEYQKGTNPTKSDRVEKAPKSGGGGFNEMWLWVVIVLAIVVIGIALGVMFVVTKRGKKEAPEAPGPVETEAGPGPRPAPRILPEAVEAELVHGGIGQGGGGMGPAPAVSPVPPGPEMEGLPPMQGEGGAGGSAEVSAGGSAAVSADESAGLGEGRQSGGRVDRPTIRVSPRPKAHEGGVDAGAKGGAEGGIRITAHRGGTAQDEMFNDLMDESEWDSIFDHKTPVTEEGPKDEMDELFDL